MTAHIRAVGLTFEDACIISIVAPFFAILGPLIFGPLADKWVQILYLFISSSSSLPFKEQDLINFPDVVSPNTSWDETSIFAIVQLISINHFSVSRLSVGRGCETTIANGKSDNPNASIIVSSGNGVLRFMIASCILLSALFYALLMAVPYAEYLEVKQIISNSYRIIDIYWHKDVTPLKVDRLHNSVPLFH